MDALCESSATFEGKTEFSQEKYKKKKSKKYCVTLTLRRPTARTLCQVPRLSVRSLWSLVQAEPKSPCAMVVAIQVVCSGPENQNDPPYAAWQHTADMDSQCAKLLGDEVVRHPAMIT